MDPGSRPRFVRLHRESICWIRGKWSHCWSKRLDDLSRDWAGPERHLRILIPPTTSAEAHGLSAVDGRRMVRHDGRMTPLTDLIAANRAFAALADQVDADAPVRNEVWSTAGAMIDHLGVIQAWATQVVRAGVPADRMQFTRTSDRQRVNWFLQTSDALVEALEVADPGRACWTLWGAEPVDAFWRRRMTNEAGKHLWDLRTAIEPDPPMPEEISLQTRVGVIDEFVELLLPAARGRGIDPLPRDVLLVAEDVGRRWLLLPRVGGHDLAIG